MIEIIWGKPLNLVVSPLGDTQKISTIEQAKYWLRKRWPVADDARAKAIATIDGAMDCLLPVQFARKAFRDAAETAGFQPMDAA